jgi:hypothetical protein
MIAREIQSVETGTDTQALQSHIHKELRHFIKLINAPDDLIGLFRIAEEFERILDLFIPIASKETESKLRRLEPIFATIQAKRSIILQAFPKADLGRRKTFTDYYGTHPHYTIYEVRPAETLFAGQLRALVASLLPVSVRLERVRLNTPDPYADVAIRLSRHIRQLSKPNTYERKLLLELPLVAQTPGDLLDTITHHCNRLGLALKGNGDLQAFHHILRVLEWFKDGAWKRLARNISGKEHRGKPGERRHVSLETTDAQRRVEIEICLGDDPPLKIGHYLPRPNETTAREENFDPSQINDITPTATTIELDTGRRYVYHLENRKRSASQNAKFKAQAIELANQNLPIDRLTLSGHELQSFLNVLDDLHESVWDGIPEKNRPIVAAWAACRFFLSRDDVDVRKIRTTGSKSEYSRLDRIKWIPQKNQFLLPAVPPKHNPPKPNSNTVETTEGFLLFIPEMLSRILKRLSQQDGELFDAPYEKLFEKLLNQICATHQFNPRLSPSRLQRVMAEQMSRMAPADQVIAIYFRGQPPNQHNPAVYSVVSVSRLQALYDEACARIGKRAACSLVRITSAEFPGFTEINELHVGSLHVPQTSSVRITVERITQRIRLLSASPGVSLPLLHNTYTAYVALFLLATSGIRAVSSLLPAAFDLDPLTGICFVSDKDTTRYGNAHLAWLHPLLVEQILLYHQHVTRLRQHLALLHPPILDRLDASLDVRHLSSHLSPNREMDQEQMARGKPTLFFLSPRGSDLLDVSPSLLASYLGQEWVLRVGALRHFVRSHLLHNNRSGEIINALLGHGERGESPWGKFSTLPPLVWREQIQEAIAPCLEKLAFVAIPSPLLAPLR